MRGWKDYRVLGEALVTSVSDSQSLANSFAHFSISHILRFSGKFDGVTN